MTGIKYLNTIQFQSKAYTTNKRNLIDTFTKKARSALNPLSVIYRPKKKPL